MTDIPRFSYYEYVRRIKELILHAFTPQLKSVLFAPMSAEGSEISVDVAVPAFVMNFEDPIPVGGVPTRDEDQGFYLNVAIRVCGYLLLPKFKVEGENERNLNMSFALCQAACNIAARIFADARGWNCGAAEIESISIETDDNFHVAKIMWSHEAVVGRDITEHFNFKEAWAKFLACPEEQAVSKFILRREDNV